MSGLELDLGGRLRNLRLPAGRAAVPLFEAVVNAIHAIEASPVAEGTVRITVVRDPASSELPLSEGGHSPIVGFKVQDDGIGFDEENWRSFRTSDSTFKSKLGGRGVGRFTWLKAFEEVRVVSIFQAEKGPDSTRRSFSFSERGISNLETERVPSIVRTGSTIELLRLRATYAAAIPKKLETLAQRTAEHCFAAIIACSKRLTVVIEDGSERSDISASVKQVFRNAEKDEFRLGTALFNVTHLRVASAEVRAHRVAYLANRREVVSDNLANSVPQLKARLTDSDGNEFWWLALVESEVLDGSVTSERDAFLLSDDASPQDDAFLRGTPSLDSIRRNAVDLVKKRTESLVAPLKQKSYERYEAYVQAKGPEYRYLGGLRRHAIEAIPADLSDEKMDLELHKVSYEVERELREAGHAIQQSGVTDEAAYEKYISEENMVGKSSLAKYVVHRRSILDVLKKALGTDAAGKFSKEEAVHRLIFPLKKTSDEVPYDQLNLWIIDERLAYHTHLASDKELRSNPVVAVDDKVRPDLLIFGRPFAFTDSSSPPLGSVLIVEFKRPVRDDYTGDDNPIAQVYDYVERVRAGKVHDLHGREFRVSNHVPFYCYVICDLTETLRKQVKYFNLTSTPDELGYFGYNAALGTYLEVVSFDKLLGDSMKRNRILFDKLNLPKG